MFGGLLRRVPGGSCAEGVLGGSPGYNGLRTHSCTETTEVTETPTETKTDSGSSGMEKRKACPRAKARRASAELSKVNEILDKTFLKLDSEGAGLTCVEELVQLLQSKDHDLSTEDVMSTVEPGWLTGTTRIIN